MIKKTVVIFGVFDFIHDGHLYFIKEAKKQGNHLVAIVARDNVVRELKGKIPKFTEADRVNALFQVHDIDLVLLGDPKIGTYNILREVKPDVVFIGYDQQALYENLNTAIKIGELPEIKVVRGKSHKPEVFHSSILNKE